MKTDQFDNLEDSLRTLSKRADLSLSKKQSIRDKIFRSIGQIELADAIVQGEQKATIAVSLQYLKKALIPQKLTFSIPITLAVVVFVFITSIVTGAVAQNSGPTDTLFPIKKVLERIELAFISNPISKAEVSLNIANERLKYLETSVTQEQSLDKVLKESQIALVSAKKALNRVQNIDDNQDNQEDISGLIERFSILLSDQRDILNNIEIEDEAENDEIKQTIIAIRGVLDEDINQKPEGDGDSVQDNVVPSVVISMPSIEELPALTEQLPLEGYHRLTGRIGTAYGAPAIFVGSEYYKAISSPIDLNQYIGYENIELGGDISDNQITVYRVVINGIVLANLLPDK